MKPDYRERNKPITAEDLIRRYNFENISKAMKAIQSNKNGLDKTNTIMNEFIEATIENIQELQDQVDGNITTWFYSGVPTLLNEPASDWNTDEEKTNHLGDLYYDQNTGYAYRFQMVNGEFSWYKLTDTDVTEALAIANAAQDTADSKRRVFVSTPTPPYDVGDIWLKDDSELYRCRTKRTSGNYSATDWIIGTKYTDDSYAMSVEAILNQYKSFVETTYATKALLETTADSINARVETNASKIENITSTINSSENANPIIIENAINTTPIDFRIYGNTKQKTYEGQQLYDIYDKKEYNAKYQIDGEGWVTLNNNNTSEGTQFFNLYTNNLKLKTNTQYAIFFEVKNVSGTGNIVVVSIDSDGSQFSSRLEYNFANIRSNTIYKSLNTTISSFENITKGLRTYAYYTNGKNGQITFRISVVEDTSITPEEFVYEQYVGGESSPNESYPQKVDNVTGANNIKMVGKNMFDMNVWYNYNSDHNWNSNDNMFFTISEDLKLISNVPNRTDYYSKMLHMNQSPSDVQINEVKTLATEVLSSTNYTLSFKNENSCLMEVFIFEYDADCKYIKFTSYRYENSDVINQTFNTSPNTKYIFMRFDNESYNTGTKTLAISELQIEKGSEATEYESYNSKTCSIDLGKNLFDYKTYYENCVAHNCTKELIDDGIKISFAAMADAFIGEAKRSGDGTTDALRAIAIKVEENTTYTLSASSMPRCFLTYMDINKNVLNSEYIEIPNSLTKTSYTFKTPNNTQYIGLRLGIISNDYTEWEFTNIQLEKGSSSTSYARYFLPLELCKIGDYQDYLYLSDGKWFLHREIYKQILDGSETWTSGGYSGTYMWTAPTYNYVHEGSDSSIPKILSNYYTAISFSDIYYNRKKGISLANQTQQSRIVIPLMTNMATTKTWLSNNNVIVYYVLLQPQDILLSKEDYPELYKIDMALLDGYNKITDLNELVEQMSVNYYLQTPLSDTYITRSDMNSALNITSNEISAITSQKIEESYIRSSNDLNNVSDSLSGRIDDTNATLLHDYYTKENTNELIMKSANGITNTFSEAGGNNLLRNTNFYAQDVIETGQTYEYWFGNVAKTSNNNSSNGISILLQNGTLYQEQIVANTAVTLSFTYKKLNNLATCYVRVNGKQYELTATEYTLFQTGIKGSDGTYIVDPIVVSDNHLKVEFITNVDNSCEIYDIMVNYGSVKLAYSQNQNETITNTVNISKGISITASDKNVKFVATPDGIRIKNKETNGIITDFTDKGTTTNEIQVKNQATIVGILRQKVGDQVWDSLM